MQSPTVSRIVHFFPASSDPLGPGPLAAIVSRVWSPTCINLGVFDGNGNSHSRTSVLFHQENAPKPAAGYATWPAREGVLLEAKLDTASNARPLEPIASETSKERQYRKKPVIVSAITFDELVAHGIASGSNVVNGMPWSFTYKGHALTHENDDCYLIPTLEGSLKMGRGDLLITGVKGEIYPCKREIFEATYDPVAIDQSAAADAVA